MLTQTIASNAMLSIAEIADRDGTSRPSVSGIVKRLVEQYDLTVERDGRGRVARVNVAQYDRLRGRSGPDGRSTSDAAKAYAEARAEKTRHEAERARLELEELSGRVVPREGVAAAGRESLVIMMAAFDLAVHETADDIARLSGLDAGLIRTRLRRMKEAAIAEFRQGLKTLCEISNPVEVTGARLGAAGLEITAAQPSAASHPDASEAGTV